MIPEEIVFKVNKIRDLIEKQFNTIVYRLIVDRIDNSNEVQSFFAKEVLEYSIPNNLEYLISIAIPVLGHKTKAHIVLQTDLQPHSIPLNTSFLTEISKHYHPYWLYDTVSYNVGYPLPFQHDNMKYQEKDRKLKGDIEGSIICNCFYTTI